MKKYNNIAKQIYVNNGVDVYTVDVCKWQTWCTLYLIFILMLTKLIYRA